VPGIAAVALLQAAIYGSPPRSGYGDLSQLFSLRFVATTVVNYPAWLAFAVGVLAAYLPYVPFTDWWYTRLTLPAAPALIILMMTLVDQAVRRLPTRAAFAAMTVVTVVLGVSRLRRADDVAVFRLKSLAQKCVDLGRLVSFRLPRNSIVVAAQPAGSVRYYAHLPTLSWDAIDPAWLDRVFAKYRARGLTPYLAVEAWKWRRSDHASGDTAPRPIATGRAPRAATSSSSSTRRTGIATCPAGTFRWNGSHGERDRGPGLPPLAPLLAYSLVPVPCRPSPLASPH
jgi:hypothetical protein